MVPGSYSVEDGKKDGQTLDVKSFAPPPLQESRISLIRFIEPEVGDVDISKEPVLIAVGRGLQNQGDIELIEELAEALGGVICASRPIVDLGWLPTSRLVGKSGKTVKPKLYLALGISGAPEHAQAITESELIIAVNTDPSAPIFELAQYGINLDILDLLPPLSERVQRVRVGV
jgi:electron transfer flavoprotein alpha subunit